MNSENTGNRIFENNTKYAAWWCAALDEKIKQVVAAVKDNTLSPSMKYLVRVKLYNIITSRIEEVYLADLLVALLKYEPRSLSVKDPDEKNQVQLWGPFFISFPIFEHIRMLYLLDNP
jgi:hypothetical protein